ncbi:MAG: hypothetical protein II547_10090, partial [Treponema sp.]|nr:hypothetical protein [Treponema sp.]
MKKISAILCISVSLLLGFAACSKTNVDKKAVFFEKLEALVKKAENNNSEERIPEIQSEYDKFFKEYSKISSISTWTKEDSEKMEDLKKRFSLSIAPMTDFSNLLTDDPLENTDTFIDNTVTDLGLDDDLNFGDSFFSDL